MKFRRKSDVSAPTDDVEAGLGSGLGTGSDEPPTGPFDVDDLPEGGAERVDLGSLLIAPQDGRELRIQVDEKSGAVQAVVLAGPDGAVEFRAFAAPRNGDLWTEVRPVIAADMAQRGGVATEREGVYGPELVCQMTVAMPDGTTGTQPTRVIGINGPRWLLRATLMGRPATEPEVPEEWADTINQIAVRRGQGAMPVGEPLPVVLPDNARRTD